MAYTTIDDPSEYFHTQLYTGTGANQDIVNNAHSGDFKPDLLWVKNRGNGSYDSQLFDSTRGLNKVLHLGSQYGTVAEETGGTSGVQTFNTNGFRGGSSSNIYQILWVNGLNNTYVAWQWKVNGGTTTSVSASGTGANCVNASTHQVNQDAGLSIITYTGRADQITVHETTNLTHGLGVTPDFTIMKKRDGTSDWMVMGQNVTASSAYSANEHLHLNTADAISDSEYTGYYAPTSTHIRLGDALVNDTGDDYVCYAFAEKQGYSKFGSYKGNGSGTSDGTFDGAFVYLGFKPAWVLIKRSSYSAGDGWTLFDNKRPPRGGSTTGNYNQNKLNPASKAVESGGVYDAVDFLSNGFKARTGRAGVNASGSKYIYMAFAENPFVTSTGIPTTAR